MRPTRLLAGLGVLAAALFTVCGAGTLLRGTTDRATDRADEPTTTTTSAATNTTPVRFPTEGRGPLVSLVAERANDAGTIEDAVGGLDATTVLQVMAVGFDWFDRAVARQCVGVGRGSCGNDLDVQFGEDGVASFQYLVAQPGADACRLDSPPCYVVLDADSGLSTSVRTLFADQLPPPGRITVSPDAGLGETAAVRVTVEGLAPNVTGQVVLCALPFRNSADRCGAPGPNTAFSADADGRVAVDLGVRAGPVGRQGAQCGRGSACAVAVVSDDAFVRAAPVPLSFRKPTGAAYDGTRLAIGLAVAALLAAVAIWLVRRTDWSPVGEEAAPEIDEAEYADLDAIVAALPPEEDEELELAR